MVQDYTSELQMLLKSTQAQDQYEIDRFHQLTVEAIQLRDKHICMFGFRASTDTGSASNQRTDPLSVCSLAMFHELMVGQPAICILVVSILSACPHVSCSATMTVLT